MLPVHFIQEALYDIEDIVIWYEEQREGLSFDFELCLEAGIEEIVRSPKAFQKRYKNVKILFIKRFPYGIHYIIRPNEITVIGIFHTSRAPKSWAKRL
ncbi:type II toxin-antitoxin system RelE/ParE family toxin [Flavobacterium psychrotrophum]|uniref:type II toxin-antitoxin system RelE/ParE family toxin n=1 Tax=Flavobacterium psychrotrophum TaxID=2294119 RepID=UPI000E3147FC|nr:type II toxin-antitoxin system RelE/ParE family toxin [Flavobacterium psychrotrophum]